MEANGRDFAYLEIYMAGQMTGFVTASRLIGVLPQINSTLLSLWTKPIPDGGVPSLGGDLPSY
ncbi:MAG: hypothetical protein F6K16_41725 [Symploca sp. SIO2B6]|nr:hypothetical protein [Symploca sp. SIO2B6]